MSETAFEEMTAGEDGWTEWVRPVPGYLMKCCGCGLVHELDVRPAKVFERLPDGTFTWDDLSEDHIAMFRARYPVTKDDAK